MKKAIAIFALLSLCFWTNLYAYDFTKFETNRINMLEKTYEKSISRSKNQKMRQITMERIANMVSKLPEESRQRGVLKEVLYRIASKNDLLFAWDVTCKVNEIKVVDNAEKYVDGWKYKLLGANLECVNSSKTQTVKPSFTVTVGYEEKTDAIGKMIDQMGKDAWTAKESDKTFTNINIKGELVGNPASKFFADKSVLSPGFPMDDYKPGERKSGWVLFQVDDKADKVFFWIVPQSLSLKDFGHYYAKVPRKDEKYMSDAAKLCKKYESYDLSDTDCLLASVGMPKIGTPAPVALGGLKGKYESCGTYLGDSTFGSSQSYCFKTLSNEWTYYYFFENELINTSSIKF